MQHKDYQSSEKSRLITEIQKDCADDCMETRETGSRWSVIYTLGAITCLLIALNSVILAVGTYNYQSRLIGGCCGILLGCLNIAAIVTIGVFRFNLIGQLAAISLVGSKYGGPITQSASHATMINSSLSTERTFHSDSEFIMTLWIIQMSLCCCHCCFSCFTNKPPNANAMAANMSVPP